MTQPENTAEACRHAPLCWCTDRELGLGTYAKHITAHEDMEPDMEAARRRDAVIYSCSQSRVKTLSVGCQLVSLNAI